MLVIVVVLAIAVAAAATTVQLSRHTLVYRKGSMDYIGWTRLNIYTHTHKYIITNLGDL